MLTMYLLLTAGTVAWIYFLWSRRQYYLMMRNFPGPLGFPFLGIALSLFKRRMFVLKNYYDNYASSIFTWVGILPAILTRDPKLIEEVLTARECVNMSLNGESAFVANFGPGLLTFKEPEWIERRKQMNPAFKHHVLLSFFPTFNAETDILLTLLDSYVNQGKKDVVQDVLRWSFRISVQTSVGADIENEEGLQDDTLLKSFQSGLKVVTLNTLYPITQIEIISQLTGIAKQKAKNSATINPVLDSIIQKKLNLKEETDTPLVIDRAIDVFRKGNMSLADLRSECAIMVTASFETTALTVYHALVLLAMHPQYQDMAFKELKDIFPTTDDFYVSSEDLEKLEYLERVVNETLRLIPSIPVFPREVSNDCRLSSGVVVPKGVVVLVDIFNTHRNRDFWGPDATKFNPDNFLPERVQERHPYAYIPFMKGRRNCIGGKYAVLSAKLALAKILRKCKMSTSFRYEDLDFAVSVGMHLVEQPRLSIERRT